MPRKAAIIGGGVIGGGWAARFLLMGWDVAVFDPDPRAAERLNPVIGRARRALSSLYDAVLPAEGGLRVVTTISEAVAGADWVQENVPERLELKRKVFQTIQEHLAPGTIIGSSTSGFTATELQDCATRPEEIIVAHPFVPVYLLPLVELVGSGKTAPSTMARAQEILSGLGMYPLHIRNEVPAHIADRLLEAVWREALWLIADGVATTEEIDEAIRMGFGLRWAQKGLFETYRIAGGAGGMRHFLHHFGPALELPWTKLMDVPEWTDDLVEKIASQSDAQAAGKPVEALETERDLNLVAMMRGLKRENSGAGVLLNALDIRLTREAGVVRRFEDLGDIGKPVLTANRTVPTDWTDYNGHMNEAKYLQAFGDATDRFMEIVGCTPEYIATGGSFFTVETHIRHLDEVLAGSPLRITTTCLDGAGKKMHLFHEMRSGDRLIATGEHLLLHVSLETRRSSPPPPEMAGKLRAIADAHAALPRPEGAGRAVGQRG